jgi:hypothetical protein
LAEDSTVPGHTVLAKAGGAALIIWDATPVIIAIVHDKLTDADANALIEHDALKVLVKLQPVVDKDAKTITVRITYNKTGDVNPAYGTPTFLGVERYATVSANAADLRGDKSEWKELDSKANVPAWFSFTILGQLPPR